MQMIFPSQSIIRKWYHHQPLHLWCRVRTQKWVPKSWSRRPSTALFIIWPTWQLTMLGCDIHFCKQRICPPPLVSCLPPWRFTLGGERICAPPLVLCLPPWRFTLGGERTVHSLSGVKSINFISTWILIIVSKLELIWWINLIACWFGTSPQIIFIFRVVLNIDLENQFWVIWKINL